MPFKMEVGKEYRAQHQPGNWVYKCVGNFAEIGRFCYLVIQQNARPGMVVNRAWVDAQGITGNGNQAFGPRKINKVAYAVLQFGENGLRQIISPLFDTEQAAIPHIRDAEKDLIAKINFTEEVADAPVLPAAIPQVGDDFALGRVEAGQQIDWAAIDRMAAAANVPQGWGNAQVDNDV